MPDSYKNFAYGTIVTAPSPATSGTTVVLASGVGALFPAPPFQATVWPAGVNPTVLNAEVIRCTAKATDALTIARAQEGSTARAIVTGDQIAATITAKAFADLWAALAAPTSLRSYYKPLSVAAGVYVTTYQLSDGTTVMTTRQVVTNTRGNFFYFDQTLGGQTGFIARWDEGDPTQYFEEVVTL